MSNIILSSGIRGIDWCACLSAFAKANPSIVHNDNVMLSSNGKFDEILLETTVSTAQLESAKKQFTHHLDSLIKDNKHSSDKKEKNGKPCLANFCSDPRYIESGDAWQACNSDKKFIFFFCSPEYYLAKHNTKNADKVNALNNWVEDTFNIWGFYTRFPESTSLVSIEDVEADLSTSFGKICESLGIETIELNNSEANAVVKSETDFEKLSCLIAQNLSLAELKNKSSIQELYENLSLVSVTADDSLAYLENERQQRRLSSCQQLCSKLVDSSSVVESNLNEQRELNLRLKAKTSELEVRNTQLENNCSEQAAECELSLLQINQLQEELEANFGQSNKAATYNAQLEMSLTELRAENELLLLQINQLQEEREANFGQSNEAATYNAQLETNLTELRSENELSLLQINQLQEELEHYYIQHQNMTYSPNPVNSYQEDVKQLKSSLLLMTLN